MSEPKPPPGDAEDFAAMFAESEARRGGNPHKRRDPKEGDLIKGRIVSIGRESTFLDLGAKSDGVIDTIELKDQDGKITVNVGDEIEARVVEIDGKAGAILLRRALGRGRGADAAKELADAHALQLPIEGLISAVNKGGLEVQVAGMRGFCPMSQIDVRPVSAEDAAALVGKRLPFLVTRFEDGPRPNVVVSRRSLLESENVERARETRGRLAVGAVLQGRVVALKDFGAFVDVGGIEGLLHSSELGYDRVAHPSDVLSIGQQVEVAIVRMEPDPKTGKERISLSLRALMADPWKEAAARLQVGSELEGKVARLESFGAFIELTAAGPGLQGLLHLSELDKGQKRIRHPKDAVAVGQTVRVTVLTIDAEARRIGLGLADESSGEPAPASGGPPERFGTFADLLKDKKR